MEKGVNYSFIPVVSVEEDEEEIDVYDIEVEDTHNFFANGILAHNSQHLVNYYLINAAKRNNVPLVVTCDAHYSNPNHWKEREIYKAIGWQQRGGEVKDLPKTIDELKCELYPKNAQQVWDSYKNYAKDYAFYDDNIVKDAIERTYDIAHSQIGDVTTEKSVKLPAIEKLIEPDRLAQLKTKASDPNDEDKIAFNELVDKAIAGLKWRKKATKEYIDRLKYELDIIKHLKLAKYFLTYTKIIDLTAKELFVGNGRGSAGGSLLAYVLNITQLDPIKFGLLMERFLSKKKKGMADIDQDWSDRGAALAIITDFFGEDNVVPVSNFQQLKPVSLIKDLSRIYGLSFDEVNKYTTKMIGEVYAVMRKEPGFDAQQFEMTFEHLQEYSDSYKEFMLNEAAQFPDFVKTLNVLFKQQRNVSRHAGGVVITNNAKAVMPLIKAKGGLQTPWAEGLGGRYLEDLGFLKFDILGLGTLRMFEETIRKILIKQGNKTPTFTDIQDFFYKNLHPDNNNFDDQKVYQHVFWEGHYAGIFQFINKNTQNFMAQLKPTNIMDIAIATSLFRPGPMGISAHELFLQNKNNPETIKYQHPLLEEVLGPTSGLIVFQEQLQLIYNRLGGIPLDETDAVRKALTKKDKANTAKQEAELKRLGEEFGELCLKNNNIPKTVSGDIYKDILKFVSYSFNKSHAFAYAITSWQCCWFLTYYPDEWITTYIDYCTIDKGKVSGKEDPKVVALAEARKLGYKINKPDINESQFEFTLDPNNSNRLVPGFASIKNVGKSATYEIKQLRPYTKVEDLLINPNGTWRHTKFNKRALSNLIKLGALESMNLVGPGKTFRNYREMHNVVIDNFDALKRVGARKKNNNVGEALTKLITESRATDCPDWTDIEKIDFELKLAGTVDIDLLVPPEVRKKLDELDMPVIDEYPFPEDGDESCVASPHWAIVKQAGVTTKNTTYLWMKISGLSGEEWRVNVWRWSGDYSHLKPNTVIAGLFTYDKKYGSFTCPRSKLYTITP